MNTVLSYGVEYRRNLGALADFLFACGGGSGNREFSIIICFSKLERPEFGYLCTGSSDKRGGANCSCTVALVIRQLGDVFLDTVMIFFTDLHYPEQYAVTTNTFFLFAESHTSALAFRHGVGVENN